MKKILNVVAAWTVAFAVMPTFASAADKFVVGYTNIADSDVFPMSVKNSFLNAAKADSNLDIRFSDANLDVSKQLDQIDNFIAQKVNAIVIVPVDYQGIVPGVEKANQAGIPVISLNIQSAGGKYTFVGSKNYDAGHLQGEFMLKKLQKNAKVLYLQGTPGLYHSKERLQGFTDAFLAKRPDVKVLSNLSGNYSRAEGMKIAEDWVQKFPQFDAIVAANDQMALGALQALKTAGRQKGVMISGIDGTADAMNAIAAGEMSQTIFQNAKGQADAAFKVIEGIKKGQTPPREVIVSFESIDKENLPKYKK